MGQITAVIPTNGTHTDTSDNTAYTTAAAVTLVVGKVYCLKTVSTAASGNAVIPAITTSGTGLTFAQVTSLSTALTTMRTTWWRFVPTVSTTATFTATHSIGQTGFMSELVEFTNADARLNGIYAFRNVTATAFAVANTSFSATYSAAFASAQSASFASFMLQLNEDITAGGGLTELSDLGIATPARRTISSFVNAPTTTPSFSWTTSNNNGGILIAEITANRYPRMAAVI